MKTLILCLPSLLLMGAIAFLHAGDRGGVGLSSPAAGVGVANHADFNCPERMAPTRPVLPRGGI